MSFSKRISRPNRPYGGKNSNHNFRGKSPIQLWIQNAERKKYRFDRVGNSIFEFMGLWIAELFAENYWKKALKWKVLN
jgi:hypothetical protein